MSPVALCFFLSALYVLVLYTDGNHRRGRDDPRVIRRRAVITSLLAATAWIPLKLTYPDDDWAQLRRKLGLRPAGAFRAAATAVGLCVCLFAGPLCMAHADSQLTSRRTLQSRAAWWRNIVVAPLTEEFFFRGCMCPLLLSGRWTTGQVIVGCPVFFGIAHAHHVLELRGIRGMPWRAACMQVGFQVMYTTVFGTFATYLLIRTGNLAAPVAAHMFCNLQGLPDFRRMLAHGPAVRAALGSGIASFVALLVALELQHSDGRVALLA